MEFSDDLIYRLHANCILVSGVSRSVICDLFRNKAFTIVNELAQLFENNLINKKLVERKFGQAIGNSFETFLRENDLVTSVTNRDDLNLFPALSLNWDIPAKIHNAIFDFDDIENYQVEVYVNAVKDLDLLLCHHLTLRFYGSINQDFISAILNIVNESRFILLDLVIDFNMICDDYMVYLQSVERINSAIFYNCQALPKGEQLARFIYTDRSICNEFNCGIVSSSYFAINVSHFTEAQSHNTCLNRKISIDKRGFIKNCPSLPKSFGHISETNLMDVYKAGELRDLWFLSKDSIKTCNKCEYRYICTDCRAYLEFPDDIHAKPLKCGYNPSDNTWEEWSNNPLKTSVIEYYSKRDQAK